MTVKNDYLLTGNIICYEPELVMTSEKAYRTIQKLRNKATKKFTDEEKRALEFAMVMIAQKVGEDVLNREEGTND